jgi:hypothetical protein
MKKLIFPFFALVLAAAPAWAGQSVCGPYAAIAGQLRAKFDEQPIYRWPSSDGSHLVEFWRSDSRRTISILAIDTRAWACVIATGANAEAVVDDQQDGEGV